MNQEYQKVWDLGVRLFHWFLVGLVALAWISVELGGYWMEVHIVSGILIAGLLLFRIIWGFVGSPAARFKNFVKLPKEVILYLTGQDKSHYMTHNPVGGWSVIAMITLLFGQVLTGLFGNDDIFIEGPLAFLISYEAQLFSTSIHKVIFNLLLTLITLHLIAIFWHQKVKKDFLIQAMFTGKKPKKESGANHEELAKTSTRRLLIVAATGTCLAAALYFV